jgi:pimeloyl-ACP methyl ester carboxylesterase
MKHGFAKTSHGAIHYMEAGSGEPVILIPSNGCSVYEYEPAMALLAKTSRPIAIDLPGHGDSDPVTRRYSIDDYAASVIAFLDALGLDRVSAGGSSLGGSIAVRLGARHGARISNLLVIEAPTRSEREWADGWLEVETNFGAPTQTAEILKTRFFCPVTPELVTRWNIDRNKTGVHTMISAMWAIRQYDVMADVPRMTTRALLVYGDRSPIVDGIQKIRSLKPDAASVRIPDAGHFPMLDHPDLFATAVADFITDFRGVSLDHAEGKARADGA